MTRNKPVILLVTLAVALFVAAGGLGALWLVEQGDHNGTSSELQTVRDDLAKTARQLADTRNQLTASTADNERLKQDILRAQPCLDAAKLMVRATEELVHGHMEAMVVNC